MSEADVIVIGLGPGGETVAGELAEADLDVVGIESELVGGECPYWGCVPSKMIVRAADMIGQARRIPGMAGTATITADFAPVAERIRQEATDNWDDTVAVDRLLSKGGRFIRGQGRIVGPGVVSVGEQTIRARIGIVVATGARAVAPPIPGLRDTPYWTNRQAVSVEHPPESLIVIGGGAIGVELAQAFRRFGTGVTVIEAGPRLLALEEPEVGQLIERVFGSEGIEVLTGAAVSRVSHDGAKFTVPVNGRTVESAALLVATGRAPDLAAVGLDMIGIDTAQRAVAVDDHLRVCDGVWAVGDITGLGAFTHVAVYQAAIATRSILGKPGPAADYRALPRVTFTDPEVGSVGLTEQQAHEQGLTVNVGIAQVPQTARGWIHKAGNEGFIKIIEDHDSGTIVGATSVGPVGGEVLGALAVAVQARVPVATLQGMIYAYPTFHRGIEDALRGL